MPKISDEEKELFRKAMKSVRRLKTVERVAVPKTRKPKPKKFIQEPVMVFNDPSIPDITAEQTVSFFRSGIHHRIFKKTYISAALDLHGETVDSARHILAEFIRYCYHKKHRYVRIVHGKGHHAILKNHVCYWLPQFPEVLAFQSALPRDGGAGAMYVLLKTG
jgi:DNA-nicking Smr family endonuclease